jgi:hypothetical protein
VETLGKDVHPFPLKMLFTWLPRPFAVYYWHRFFARQLAEYIFARHARHSAAEMRALAADCRQLLAKSGVVAPALDRLYWAIDDYASAHDLQSS